MDSIEQLIEICHKVWKQRYNVLSIRKSTKFVNGRDTGVPCITFYVINKYTLSSEEIRNNKMNEFIPKEINSVPTDVVELSTDDYQIGHTAISDETPEQQRKRSSGVKR